MENSLGSTPYGLDNIKRVVVMMFENRSFDHIFGAWPGANGLFKDGKINGEYYNLPDPLSPPGEGNLPVYPAPLNPSLPQAKDFNHNFGDGMMPSLLGPIFTVCPPNSGPLDYSATYTSGYADGKPVGGILPSPPTYPATNSGFYSTYRGGVQQGNVALTYFEHGKLKVLHELAKHYVLCDNWYCDMPGHTEPNRCFIHCGTTSNVQIDDSDGGRCLASSIFDVINSFTPTSGPSGWKLYAPSGYVDGVLGLGQFDTGYLNYGLQNAAQNVDISNFAADCNSGALPFYSFIMCWLPAGSTDAWTDTSMHPNALIQPGENLLAAVYNTLRNSPCWEDTLLVITFDENGGLYDHVVPPNVTPPVPGLVRPPPQSGSSGTNWKLDETFDFSLLGLRVPAMLISPWLSAGIDSQQYQNTSVLRFLLERMSAASDHRPQHLTARDANAPQLDSAFSQFGQSTLRNNCPSWIAPYTTLPSCDPYTSSNAIPYADGKLTTPWNPPSQMRQAKPVAYINELLSLNLKLLPGHPDSGKPIDRQFATNAHVVAYLEERRRAAEGGRVQ